ncbi:MAG TPA: DHH family phosphoesterase [Candidatus Kapabacteria bacterium]|nr:DHH family phosphoesterase [Candidatus Kapabacteria bacterium]
MSVQIAKQIYNKIMEVNHVFLIPHQHPDGDALGAVGSFMQFLKNSGKSSTAFCATEVSPRLRFIPHAEEITNDPSVWTKSEFDLIVVFDSGDLRYAGVADYIAALPKKPFIICFDHHATNEQYGDLNFVVVTASSTTEILYRFYTHNNVTIDKHMATCLLTGLITDTDNFTNAGTTAASLAIAGDLVKRGGDINLIKGAIFKDKTVNTLKLWGTILSRLAKHEEHNVVYTYLKQHDLTVHNVSEQEVEGVANFMNNLQEGRAALILKELPDGKVKGSFRTTRNDTDVAKIAKKLGGGGHKKAAGFTIDGTIENALEKIWEAIRIHGLELEPVETA